MRTTKQIEPDRQIRLGALIFLLGMLATVVAMSPAVTGIHLGTIWWSLSMLTGIGLCLLLLGFRKQAKRRSKLVADFKDKA